LIEILWHLIISNVDNNVLNLSKSLFSLVYIYSGLLVVTGIYVTLH